MTFRQNSVDSGLYEFRNDDRQITRISRGLDSTRYSDIVLGSCEFAKSGCTEFSFRITQRSSGSFIFIGAAIEPTPRKSLLNAVGWCLDLTDNQLYARGAAYFKPHSRRVRSQAVQVVTVRVDVARKQIVYVVDGVPAGPPHTMNISDADLLRLRPAVQIIAAGDSVEIA